MAKNECSILKGKCEITFNERNILVTYNQCLNAKIDAIHNSIYVLNANVRITHKFLSPLFQST